MSFMDGESLTRRSSSPDKTHSHFDAMDFMERGGPGDGLRIAALARVTGGVIDGSKRAFL
jgi:hypothetical protein